MKRDATNGRGRGCGFSWVGYGATLFRFLGAMVSSMILWLVRFTGTYPEVVVFGGLGVVIGCFFGARVALVLCLAGGLWGSYIIWRREREAGRVPSEGVNS